MLSISQKIHHLFVEKGWTLSLAESCTGGAISALFVKEAGASDFFLGGIVSYSAAAKQKLLHVTASEMVSESCALQMAQGVRKQFGSTYAASVTGEAGPSGSQVGRVWFALASASGACATSSHFAGERSRIISLATDELLYFLWNHVSTH